MFLPCLFLYSSKTNRPVCRHYCNVFLCSFLRVFFFASAMWGSTTGVSTLRCILQAPGYDQALVLCFMSSIIQQYTQTFTLWWICQCKSCSLCLRFWDDLSRKRKLCHFPELKTQKSKLHCVAVGSSFSYVAANPHVIMHAATHRHCNQIT